MHWIRKFIRDRRAELDEAVFVIPVLLLVTFGLINFGILGYASVSASNATHNHDTQDFMDHLPRPFACDFILTPSDGQRNVTLTPASRPGMMERPDEEAWRNGMAKFAEKQTQDVGPP